MIFVLVPYTSSVKIALCMRDEIGVWVEGIAAAAPARPRCPIITCPASARADCVGIALVRCGGDRAHKTAARGPN